MPGRGAIIGTIYLLCFSTRFKHAGHYLGWASDLEARLDQHRNKTGARLVAVILEAGLNFFCVRTWTGTRTDERRLKNRKETPRLCPRCNGKLALRRAVDLKRQPAARAAKPQPQPAPPPVSQPAGFDIEDDDIPY